MPQTPYDPLILCPLDDAKLKASLRASAKKILEKDPAFFKDIAEGRYKQQPQPAPGPSRPPPVHQPTATGAPSSAGQEFWIGEDDPAGSSDQPEDPASAQPDPASVPPVPPVHPDAHKPGWYPEWKEDMLKEREDLIASTAVIQAHNGLILTLKNVHVCPIDSDPMPLIIPHTGIPMHLISIPAMMRQDDDLIFSLDDSQATLCLPSREDQDQDARQENNPAPPLQSVLVCNNNAKGGVYSTVVFYPKPVDHPDHDRPVDPWYLNPHVMQLANMKASMLEIYKKRYPSVASQKNTQPVKLAAELPAQHPVMPPVDPPVEQPVKLPVVLSVEAPAEPLVEPAVNPVQNPAELRTATPSLFQEDILLQTMTPTGITDFSPGSTPPTSEPGSQADIQNNAQMSAISYTLEDHREGILLAPFKSAC
eukprot:gene4239-biopygen21967